MNAVIQRARLDHVDDMLLASGWMRDQEDLWTAPESLSEALAHEVGPGRVKRWIAISAQIQADEQIVSATS
jgi:hypothetical protein